LEKALKSGQYSAVYTCGPEMMMVAVVKMAKEAKVDSQVSLERYMKCGFGICGQCCMDSTGFRACKDGPVVDGKLALQLTEFGNYKRTASGIRCDL
jgi:dihydroorotate dehydrogenase electron transfer subunit